MGEDLINKVDTIIKECYEDAFETSKSNLMDILDEIKAEIEALPKTYPFMNHIDTYVKEDDVLQIISKYKAKEDS